MKFFLLILTPILFLILSTVGRAGRAHHLVLIGGGNPPDAAVERYLRWAGGAEAHILIIPWATAEEKAGYTDWHDTFVPYHPKEIVCAPLKAEMPAQNALFLDRLRAATAVFFVGGDQNRIMDVLKDEGPLSALRQRYQEGIVFGGTSAGTAIMSHWMMTGNDNLEAIGMDAVQLREGLDLLPPQVMVDTHFIRRQRENRLFSALWLHPDVLGLGIDQGMAVLIEADRWMEVLGPTQVMAVQPESLGKRFIVNLLFSGERYDLERRQTVSN